MSMRKKLGEFQEQKRLLVLKADLQRSTLLMIVQPVFKVIRASEAGVFAAKTGMALVRHLKH